MHSVKVIHTRSCLCGEVLAMLQPDHLRTPQWLEQSMSYGHHHWPSSLVVTPATTCDWLTLLHRMLDYLLPVWNMGEVLVLNSHPSLSPLLPG